MLRASSLPAVTSLVWSTSPKPAQLASARRTCRTRMRSASEAMVTAAGPGTLAASSAIAVESAQECHPLLDVQRGMEMAHRHAKLHEREGHRGLDAYDGGVRAEQSDHADHSRDDAGDEGIDHVEAAHVDERALGCCPRDLPGHLVLYHRHGRVIQLAAQGHEQRAPDPCHRNVDLHAGWWVATTASATATAPARSPTIWNASWSACRRVLRLRSRPRSIPRWTMARAVSGRTPLMMLVAPMSVAACTVRSRCWATWVSVVGTPLMSRMTTSACSWAIRSSRLSVIRAARSELRVPMMGSASTLSQTWITGVESSRMSSCWRRSRTSCSWRWVTSLIAADMNIPRSVWRGLRLISTGNSPPSRRTPASSRPTPIGRTSGFAQKPSR